MPFVSTTAAVRSIWYPSIVAPRSGITHVTFALTLLDAGRSSRTTAPGMSSCSPSLSMGCSASRRDRVQHVGSGINTERQDRPHPHSSILSPDGRFVIVADLGIDRLVVYAFDDQSSSLVPHGEFQAKPGSGPRHLSFHPGGRFLFVVNEFDSTISVLSWRAEDGTAHEVQTVSTPPEGAEAPNLAADMHVARSGRQLYVSNRGHDSVTTYAFHLAGRLEPVATQSSGGDWPRGFGIASEGGSLVVANERSGNVSLLSSRNPESHPGDAIAKIDVYQPTCVTLL
jgi:6-phosphogluconolactonase